MPFFDFAFWQNFGSNLLATIIGVALGIPVAFWINSKLELTTEKEKKKKILELLSAELTKNKHGLLLWLEHKDENHERIRYSAFLSDEIWHALSDGGEIHWIKDVLLLGALANAYGEIRHIKYLYEARRRIIESSLPWNSEVEAQVISLLGEQWPVIQEALDQIEAAMQRITFDLHGG